MNGSDVNLSPRECECMALICRGLSNAQIARSMGVSLSTAKTHVEHALAKLGVANRTRAAVIYTQATA